MDDPVPGSALEPNAPTQTSSLWTKQRQLKRVLGEMSCAECRRLKVRCDKKVPCSTCIRRGCQSVCPTGTLPSKSEKSANPDSRLRKKVIQMSKRIRQLEDALKILQARVSSSPHPLLAKELLEIKKDSNVDSLEVHLDSTGEEICDNFGTLTIAEEGRTNFIGRTGGDAMIETAYDKRSEEVKRVVYSKLPPEITHLATTFPFSSINNSKETIIAAIESRLPTYERATALVEAYIQHIACFFRPVRREQIMEELIPKFFKRNRNARYEPVSSSSPRYGSEIFEHQLALLFAVFACGAAGDLTLEACNEEGETYRQLARSALSLHSVFEGTSLATVQAVALIGAFDVFSASMETIETPFKMLTLALSLGITIGLHWDPSSWNIELKFVQRRRSLFWELYQMEASKSLVSGRPMMLHLRDIDCKLPDDDDARVNEDGTATQGYWRWKIEYSRKIVSVVAQRMCTAQPMKYADILELDREVREYPEITTPPPDSDSCDPVSILQGIMKVIQCEAVLFFIHRNFFIMGIRENPKDPLRSRFASSFLATYSSSVTILRAIRKGFERLNHLLLRQWTLWVRALGCGVAIGSIAATNSQSELSQTALEELELVIDLFEKATTHPVAKNGLPILWRLRDKAKSKRGSATASATYVKVEEVDEALKMIGGMRRLIRRGRPPTHLLSADVSAPLPSSLLVPPEISDIGQASTPGTAMEGQQSDKSGWGTRIPSTGYSISNYSATMTSNESGSSETSDATQPGIDQSPLYPMNLDMTLDNFEFNYGGAQQRDDGFFLDTQWNQQMNSTDQMIEDVWRTILEDPRLTDTGMNETTFHF